MPAPIQPTGRLVKWSRKGNDFYGTVDWDKNGMFDPGDLHSILEHSYKRVLDMGDKYYVVTFGWIWQLDKAEEIT